MGPEANRYNPVAGFAVPETRNNCVVDERIFIMHPSINLPIALRTVLCIFDPFITCDQSDAT